MLKHTDSEHRPLNPLDFDINALDRASKIMLGKAKSQELYKNKGPKGLLLILGALEAEADAVRKEPARPLPADASPEDPELRNTYAEEIQQWKQLHLSATQEMYLPYRMRGENQRKAIMENDVTVLGDKETAYLRISLKDLKQTVKSVETSGRCLVEMTMDPKRAEFIQKSLGQKKISLQFQDELAERPENKRAWLGNVVARCEERAKTFKTTPARELARINENFSGKRVTMLRNGDVENISVRQENGKAVVSVEVKFPEIEIKIADWKEATGRIVDGRELTDAEFFANNRFNDETNTDQPNPAIGALTDGSLLTHCSLEHGCNGRDFVEVSPTIANTMITNAVDTAHKWMKNSGGEEILPDFVKDYGAVALTFRPRMKPASKLEPIRSKINSAAEILPPFGSPEEIYAVQGTRDIQTSGMSGPGLTAGEWLKGLTESEVLIWSSDEANQYAEALEERFGITNSVEKSKNIHKNFLGLDTTLDGGLKSVKFEAPVLTDSLEEEFEAASEAHFVSKEDEADYLDKGEWLSEKGGSEIIELPTNPAMLQRMKRYDANSKKFRISKSKIERFDPEVRLGLQPSTKWEKTKLALKDLLTEDGKKELDNLRNNGSEFDKRMMSEINATIEGWLTNRRPLDPMSKNPLELRVRRWLEAVAQGRDTELCSLNELTTIFGPSVRNAGKIPFGNDKAPKHLMLPVQSNPLPLLLLCGDKSKAFNKLRNNPERLWDTTMRINSAIGIHEEPLPDREEPLMDALQDIQNKSDDEILAQAVAAELSEKPDTLYAYLREIELPYGFNSLPSNLQDLTDLCNVAGHKSKLRAPNTTVIRGEEVAIDEIIDILKENKIEITLSAAEETEIEKSVRDALTEWARSMKQSTQMLSQTEKASGKDARINLMLSPVMSDSEEIDPLDKAIAMMHEVIPQTKTDIGDIATVLDTYNPGQLEITTNTEAYTLQRGSGGQWMSKSADPAAEEIAAKINRVERLMENPDAPDMLPEELESIQRSKQIAAGNRVILNVDKIQPALDTIPTMLASRPNIREIAAPLRLLTEQFQAASEHRTSGEKILNEWALGAEDTVWGWNHEIDIRPEKSIELITQKIVGKKEEKVANDRDEPEPEKERNYLVQTLITNAEKAEATNILENEGRKAAAFFLKLCMDKNMENIRRTAQETLPELVTTLRDRLDVTRKANITPEAIQNVETSPLGTYLRDRTKYQKLAEKIRVTANKLAALPKEENPLHAIGNHMDTKIVADAATGVIKTDKTWATGWLKTKTGQENLAMRVNLLNWVRDTVKAGEKPECLNETSMVEKPLRAIAPKAAVAFLAFCSHAKLPTSEAVANGGLTAADKQILQTGAERFQDTLRTLGIDPENHRLRTMLVASSAINQYCDFKYTRNNPWNTEWEKPLDQIKPKEFALQSTLNVEHASIDKAMTSVPSPFKKASESEMMQQETETKRKQAISMKRAAQSLYRSMS